MNPAIDQTVAMVQGSSPIEVNAAVNAAHAAYEKDWRWRPFMERAQMLLSAAKVIREHAEELARLETSENGKVYSFARHTDIEQCISSFEFFGGIPATSIANSFIDGGSYYDQRVAEPYGVVAAIIQANWPAINLASKLAPALVMGNTVVLKPSSAAPLTALRIIELIAPIFPSDVLQVVLGAGAVVGKALVAHPQVRKVAITGSTPAGIEVMKTAANRLTPTSTTLSGKNAAIIFDDADETAAVRTLLEGAFANQGESRTALSLFLLQRRIHDRILPQLANATLRLRVGDGMEPQTHIGPVGSRHRQQHALAAIESAMNAGARLVAQARVPTSKPLCDGYFVPPTLLSDVTLDMAVTRDQLLAPIAAVMSFRTAEDAVAIVNDSDFGMLSVVFTQNHNLATRLSRRLDVGTVFLNNYERSGNGVLFNGGGAIKASGTGGEGRSLESLREFSRQRLVRTATGAGELQSWSAINDILS